VKDGTYNENVNVNKRLTIRSENGSALTTVKAASTSDHVFNVTVDYVNISGFNVTGATDGEKAGIYLGSNVDHCNVSDNNVSNNRNGIVLETSSSNTLTNNTANSNTYYGIYLNSSSNNTLTNNTANSNTKCGIYLDSSSNYNTLTNNTANSNTKYGIHLVRHSSNNTLTNNTASNTKYGIGLSSSSNNTLTNNTANSNTYHGIYLDSSSNNTLTNNTANSNTKYGIYLYRHSSNNTLTNNTASNNTLWDFYSHEDAYNNTVEDLTIASYPTTISFTYDNGIGLKGVTTPPEPDPAGKLNISKFVNATNVTADSWIFLNVSCEEGDLGGVDENSLRMWKHNGTDWTEVPGTNGVNTVENYVYANITEFSVFAPLGNVTALSPKLCTTPDDPPSHDFGIVPPGKTRNWTFEIINCGDPGSTLNWNVTKSEPWISVSPSSGTNTTVTVTIDKTKLSDGGVKTGTLTVNSDGGTKTGTIRVNIELETAPETGYATFATTGGYFDSVEAVAEKTLPEEGKPNLVFPHGFFSFTIQNLTAGQGVTVNLVLPSAMPANAEYWKYGPTPDNPTSHWYRFMYDGQTGAEINGNLVTLHFVDGQRGDDNPTLDGKIVDQGGPGSSPIPVPEFNAVGLLSLVGILSVVLAVAASRKK
jgi:parallel beta-helix repeat protein